MSTNFEFLLSRDHYLELGKSHAAAYQANKPYPHIVIDNFLPAEVCDTIIRALPGDETQASEKQDATTQLKRSFGYDPAVNPLIRHMFNEFNGPTLLAFLETLTGIEGLAPDPYLYGGGVHQTRAGGFLKIHADFNWHKKLRLDRRINLILFLNPNWDPSWGGELELWDDDMTRCEHKILPVANRCVVFNTTDFSMHGHPDPVRCPENVRRSSLAFYYYTNGRPAEEVRERGRNETDYRERPSEGSFSGRSALKDWVPPALLKLKRKWMK